jgi:hypothetical protein
MWLCRWVRKAPPGKGLERSRARPCLEPLEARLTPVNYTWRGVVNGLWSDRTNWAPNTGVPGAADTAIFDGANNNASRMDLRNVVSVLRVQGYTGTIKLQRALSVEVLTMSSGTITLDPVWLDGGGVLNHLIVAQTTNFAASSWTGGTIGDGNRMMFDVAGEADHTLTFDVGGGTGTPTFAGRVWTIGATPSRTVVNWNQGNINMARLPTARGAGEIQNHGTFFARSTGMISSPIGTTWWFTNFGDVVLKGDKQFLRGLLRERRGSNTYKQAGLDGSPGTFAVAAVDQAGGNLRVEAGTFQVDGDFTQAALAAQTIDPQPAGLPSLSAHSRTVLLPQTALYVGGALGVYDGLLDAAPGTAVYAADGLPVARGGAALLEGTDVLAWVRVEEQGTLSVSGDSTVHGDVVNDGLVSVGGYATLTVNGDSYTQTGELQITIVTPGPYGIHGSVDVFGSVRPAVANLGGTLDIVFDYVPQAGDVSIDLVNYDSRTGMFDLTDPGYGLAWRAYYRDSDLGDGSLDLQLV